MVPDKQQGDMSHLVETASRKACHQVQPAVRVRGPFSTSNVKLLIWCSVAGLLFLATVGFTFLTFPYPLPASCSVRWNVGRPCHNIQSVILLQMTVWDSCRKCEARLGGCQYILQGAVNNSIYAIHTSGSGNLVEDIAMDFLNYTNQTCIVLGKSSTRSWYVLFDYGMNYCNLHSLAIKAGLTNDTTFIEATENRVCTQFSVAKCGY